MKGSPLRILLVEDDEDDYLLTREALTEVYGRDYRLEWAATYDDGRDAIFRGEHDICLLDYRLGARDGIDLLREAVDGGCRAPIVLLTGQGDRDVDLEAMRAGAADYLIKGEVSGALLERSIRYALERKRAAEAEHFLAEVGRVLASSLDYAETLRRVAELAVPTLADFCLVEMAGEEDDASRAGATQLRDLLRLDPEGGYRTEDPVDAVLRTGMPLLLAPGGAKAPGSAMIVPLLARDRTTGALIFAAIDSGRHYDTADLALAEELARRAALAIDNARLYHEAQEAIRVRDEVHRIVAHDLRNPLYGIKLMLSLIAKRVRAESDWAEEAEYAELARQAVQRMERLIQDMLDVARLEAGSLSIECERQGAAALLVETITFHQTLATDSALEFEHLAPADLPEVLADRGRVLQVFGNLIGNAIKFTPAGGRITLRAEVAGLEIRFSVADTGPGIPPDHLPHLFDRFWQAERGRRDGAGLGLAIARGIVEAHGGRIWAESALGAGTAFHFTLPVAPVAAS